MNQQGQRGSAIIMLFIAIALFAALSYAFLKSSDGSTSMMTNEAAKASATALQDCTNTIDVALKRLRLRGCGNYISIASDGSNSTTGAPTDGSCSVYHPNGGGVKSCGNMAAAPAPPTDACIAGAIGTACTTDSAVYIGSAGGNRVYISSTNSSTGIRWKTATTTTAGTTSTSDGVANTDAMIAAGAASHPAAQACRALGAAWYVPSRDELALLWTNRAQINLTGIGVDTGGNIYWASTQDGSFPGNGWTQRFMDGYQASFSKNGSYYLRCIRR